MTRSRPGRTAVVATVVTLASFGLGAVLTACSSPDPVTASSSPSTSPSPSPSVSPLAPGEMPPRLVGADGATLLDAAENPRTGEVWFDVAIEDDPGVPILSGTNEAASLVHVGSRGDAEIYLRVLDEWDNPGGGASALEVFEVRDGQAFLIACPSPAQEACPSASGLMNPSAQGYAPGVAVDGEVFYDSLSLPATFRLDNGIELDAPRVGYVSYDGSPRTYWGAAWSLVAGIAGDRFGPPADWPRIDAPSVVTVARHGQWSLVEYETEGMWGLPTVNLMWISPLDTTYNVWGLGTEESPISAETVDWLDGLDPVVPEGYRPELSYEGAAIPVCHLGGFATRDPEHDPAAWRVGGTLPSGGTVYIPVEGGNEWSSTIWDAYYSSRVAYEGQNTSDSGEAAFLRTEEAFLDANALIEIEGFDGDWWMLVSRHASVYTYECFG